MNVFFVLYADFLPVDCFLKTGIRPMNGNFLPLTAGIGFLAACGLSETLVFLSDFPSFLSLWRSLDFERE